MSVDPYDYISNHMHLLSLSISGLRSFPELSDVLVLYDNRYNAFKQAQKILASLNKDVLTNPENANKTLSNSTQTRKEAVDELISIFKEHISNWIKNIDSLIETARNQRSNLPISDTQQLLNSLKNKLKSTGNVEQEFMDKISKTKNEALDRYLISILSSQEKKKKYPWTFYTPGLEDIKDQLYITSNDDNPKKIKEKYIHNFNVIVKQLYFTTKTNIRNISMLRLADVNDVSDTFSNYKNILQYLLFISVPNNLVPGDYTTLLHDYSSHTNSLSTLLGDNYKKLIRSIVEDSKLFNEQSENKTKTVKTETLLKYILKAIQKINYSNIDQYNEFYSEILGVIQYIIEANSNISQLSSIVDLSGEYNRSDLMLRHNRINNVYTFVKIRADKNESLTETNQRYRVGLDNHRQIMYMGYESSPENIYDSSMSLKNEYNYLSNNNSILPNNYLFGPFSYIFKPDDDNSKISNHKSIQPLVEKVRKGGSVCVIGYGSSGSGKTTTLVYANFEKTQSKRNGILIHFCDILREDYGEIEISFVELEGNINEMDNDVINNFKILPIPSGQENKLNSDNTPKYNSDDIERQLYFQNQSFVNMNGVNGKEWVLKDDTNLLPVENVKFEKGLRMGKYIVTIMDYKRSIQATTNNPVSSRSHMIIFVKFKKKKSDIAKEKEPYLIICDFAGVENKFQCKNEDVLNMFENIKSQTKCKDKVEKGKCNNFKEFYNVKETIEKRLNSDEAKYEPPSELIKVNISPEFRRGLLFRLFKDNDKFKNKFEKIFPVLDKIIIDLYDKNKMTEFVKAIKKIKDIVGSPDYPTLQNIKDNLKYEDTDIKKSINELWTLFGITKNVMIIKYGEKKQHIRDMPKFIRDLYSSGLRADDYNNIYDDKLDKFRKSKKDPSRSMPADILREVNAANIETVKSPIMELIQKYCEEVQNELESQNEINEDISTKTNIKNKILSETSEIRHKMLYDICDSRMKEGLFINNSLSYLRDFISYFITKIQRSGMSPKFINECAPIQCNPNYESCFSDNVVNKNATETSVIANVMREKLCMNKSSNKNMNEVNVCEDFRDMTFCIFNVINLSKRANNPPPIPHIDITNLMLELNRLNSLSSMLINDDNISDESSNKNVHLIYLSELKNNKLLNGLNTDDKKVIIDLIIKLEKGNESDVNVTINALKKLIEQINISNSLTLIGTLEFTDMISKFGLNRLSCNYTYKENMKISGEQTQDFIDTLSEYKGFILSLHEKYNESIITV